MLKEMMDISSMCYVFLSEYAIKSDKGKMEVIIHNQSKKYLHPGDGFGELALLYNAPRSATCRAIDDCYLWAINRATFKGAVTEMITKEYQENRKFIEDISFFSSFSRF